MPVKPKLTIILKAKKPEPLPSNIRRVAMGGGGKKKA